MNNPNTNEPDKFQHGRPRPTRACRASSSGTTGYFPKHRRTLGRRASGNLERPLRLRTETGEQIDRWPTNVGAIPNGDSKFTQAPPPRPTSATSSSSLDIPFAPGGEPGDVYDNDVADETVEIVSVDEGGEHIQKPIRPASPKTAATS